MVIMDEVKKAVSGKDNVIWQVLTAILAVYGAWRMGIKKREKDFSFFLYLNCQI